MAPAAPDNAPTWKWWEPLLYLLIATLLLLRQLPPGRIVGTEDGGAIIYVNLVFLGRAVGQGEIPLWDPYKWCGQTFAGSQNSPIYYPTNYLSAFMPADRYLLLALIGHIFLGGCGISALFRRWKLADAAPWAACAFMTSAPIFQELERLPIIQITGLLPWFLYCIDRTRENLRWAAPAALILGLQLVAGFHQAVQLEGAIAACLLLGPWRDRGRWLGLVVGGILGCGLAAVGIVPFLTHLQETTRSLALPGYYHVNTTAAKDLPAIFLPSFFRYSDNTLVSTPYGLPVAWGVLALFALRRSCPIQRGGLILVGVGLLLTFSDGSPWEGLLDSIVPTYASCRFRVRFLELVSFGTLLLAALGYRRLKTHRPAVALTLVGLGLLESLYLSLPYNPPVGPDHAVNSQIFAQLDPRYRYVPSPRLFKHYWNWGAVVQISAVGGYGSLSNRLYEDVSQFAESGQPARPDNIQAALNDNNIRQNLDPASPVLRIFSPQADLWSVEGGPPQIRWLPTPTPRLALCSKVSEVADSQAALQRMAAPDFDPAQEVVLESPLGLTLQHPDNSEVNLRHFSPNTVDIEASIEGKGPVLLRIGEIWEEGWHTQVDGQNVETLRVDHCLRGVLLSPGRHLIHQYYWPHSLELGLKISGLSALLLLGFLAVMSKERSA